MRSLVRKLTSSMHVERLTKHVIGCAETILYDDARHRCGREKLSDWCDYPDLSLPSLLLQQHTNVLPGVEAVPNIFAYRSIVPVKLPEICRLRMGRSHLPNIKPTGDAQINI